MTDPKINTVFNSFRLLLEGDKAVLGDIKLISIERIQQWVAPKSEEIPIEVRSMFAHNLTDKAATQGFKVVLKKVFLRVISLRVAFPSGKLRFRVSCPPCSPPCLVHRRGGKKKLNEVL